LLKFDLLVPNWNLPVVAIKFASISLSKVKDPIAGCIAFFVRTLGAAA
jgi:hypothetical protein